MFPKYFDGIPDSKTGHKISQYSPTGMDFSNYVTASPTSLERTRGTAGQQLLEKSRYGGGWEGKE
jgi:hypothetical protein